MSDTTWTLPTPWTIIAGDEGGNTYTTSFQNMTLFYQSIAPNAFYRFFNTDNGLALATSGSEASSFTVGVWNPSLSAVFQLYTNNQLSVIEAIDGGISFDETSAQLPAEQLIY